MCFFPHFVAAAPGPCSRAAGPGPPFRSPRGPGAGGCPTAGPVRRQRIPISSQTTKWRAAPGAVHLGSCSPGVPRRRRSEAGKFFLAKCPPSGDNTGDYNSHEAKGARGEAPARFPPLCLLGFVVRAPRAAALQRLERTQCPSAPRARVGAAAWRSGLGAVRRRRRWRVCGAVGAARFPPPAARPGWRSPAGSLAGREPPSCPSRAAVAPPQRACECRACALLASRGAGPREGAAPGAGRVRHLHFLTPPWGPGCSFGLM